MCCHCVQVFRCVVIVCRCWDVWSLCMVLIMCCHCVWVLIWVVIVCRCWDVWPLCTDVEMCSVQVLIYVIILCAGVDICGHFMCRCWCVWNCAGVEMCGHSMCRCWYAFYVQVLIITCSWCVWLLCPGVHTCGHFVCRFWYVWSSCSPSSGCMLWESWWLSSSSTFTLARPAPGIFLVGSSVI